MNRFTVISAAVTSMLLTAPVLSQQPPEKVTANDFIELFQKLGGKHPGFRKAHAAGVCATGTFTPNSDVSQYSKSVLFEQASVPALVRFSLGGPNPSSDEKAPGTRGVGIQLALPNGGKLHFTGNNTPFFTGKDPETFFGFLQTLLPDENGERDPNATGAYIAANPSVMNAVKWSQTNPAPSSFAREKYFGIHTFFFEDNAGKQTMYRWDLTPDAGEENLTEEQAAALPTNFLEQRLKDDLSTGKVSFTLSATIGETGDAVIDPSVAWPDDRATVTLGSLTLTEAGGDTCNPVNFDPNVLTAGFKSSDDPVLRMRSPAYGISLGKRLSNQ